MRAISDEAVKALINSGICTDTDADREYVCECIDNIPTIEPKRGEWVIVKEPIEKYGEVLFDCSACGLHFYRTEHRQGAKIGWNFCPNCGADMREREGE